MQNESQAIEYKWRRKYELHVFFIWQIIWFSDFPPDNFSQNGRFTRIYSTHLSYWLGNYVPYRYDWSYHEWTLKCPWPSTCARRAGKRPVNIHYTTSGLIYILIIEHNVVLNMDFVYICRHNVVLWKDSTPFLFCNGQYSCRKATHASGSKIYWQDLRFMCVYVMYI